MITARLESLNSGGASKKIGFSFLIACYILAFATQGFGDFRFGFINASFSTYFIYIAFFFQFLTGFIRIPKLLLGVYFYIFIQSYILNALNIDVGASTRHFLGFILYSISVFSFLSFYRGRILDIIRIYYKFVFGLVCLVFLQTVLFIFFELSFKPQQILSGLIIANNNNPFFVEILNFLPRAVGLSAEPAHYALITLPGAYLALLVLTGRGSELTLGRKRIAVVILTGFILSFSLVGYLGLFFCLISIFANKIKGKLMLKSGLAVIFIALIYFISLSSLRFKLNGLPVMFSEGIESYEYTSSDLSAFALVSNLIVTRESLLESHYMGKGFNTHQDSYDKSIYTVFSKSQVIAELNRENAGSLFLRLLSEFGIPGLLIFLYFLFYFWVKNGSDESILEDINHMSIVMIVCYSLRNGGYIDIHLIFFMALSYYTFIMLSKKNLRKYPRLS